MDASIPLASVARPPKVGKEERLESDIAFPELGTGKPVGVPSLGCDGLSANGIWTTEVPESLCGKGAPRTPATDGEHSSEGVRQRFIQRDVQHPPNVVEGPRRPFEPKVTQRPEMRWVLTNSPSPAQGDANDAPIRRVDVADFTELMISEGIGERNLCARGGIRASACPV